MTNLKIQESAENYLETVLVLSKRPATIHLDLPTIFEDQTLSPMNRRQAPEFQGYFNQIWKELNHHE